MRLAQLLHCHDLLCTVKLGQESMKTADGTGPRIRTVSPFETLAIVWPFMQHARGSAKAARAGSVPLGSRIQAAGDALPGQGHEFGKAAILVESQDLHLPAAIVFLPLAGTTFSAGDTRPDLDQITFFQDRSLYRSRRSCPRSRAPGCAGRRRSL